MNQSRSKLSAVLAAAAGALIACGCGLEINAGDLFLIKRTGAGRTLTLLVNDSGTVRCNGGPPRSLPDPMLLSARDLVSQLDQDANAKLHLPAGGRSVFFYSVRLQGGTISFPDTAAATHHELALTEQFVLRAVQGPCRPSR